MSKSFRRRGMILLQTLVISVILSMIAVMVLKWVMGRYMIAARNYNSTRAKAHAHGYAMERFSYWNFNLAAIPTNGTTTIDSKVSTFITSGPPGPRTFVFTSNEDQ